MIRFIIRNMLKATFFYLTLLSAGINTFKMRIDPFALVFGFIWLVGVVYSAPHYLSILEKNLDSMLKISAISFLAIGRGSLGLLCLFMYLMYYLFFGWIYGLYLLVFDIVITVRVLNQDKREQGLL